MVALAVPSVSSPVAALKTARRALTSHATDLDRTLRLKFDRYVFATGVLETDILGERLGGSESSGQPRAHGWLRPVTSTFRRQLSPAPACFRCSGLVPSRLPRAPLPSPLSCYYLDTRVHRGPRFASSRPPYSQHSKQISLDPLSRCEPKS